MVVASSSSAPDIPPSAYVDSDSDIEMPEMPDITTPTSRRAPVSVSRESSVSASSAPPAKRPRKASQDDAQSLNQLQEALKSSVQVSSEIITALKVAPVLQGDRATFAAFIASAADGMHPDLWLPFEREIFDTVHRYQTETKCRRNNEEQRRLQQRQAQEQQHHLLYQQQQPNLLQPVQPQRPHSTPPKMYNEPPKMYTELQRPTAFTVRPTPQFSQVSLSQVSQVSQVPRQTPQFSQPQSSQPVASQSVTSQSPVSQPSTQDATQSGTSGQTVTPSYSADLFSSSMNNQMNNQNLSGMDFTGLSQISMGGNISEGPPKHTC